METLQKERLKLIIRNLKLLLDSLESEVYSDVEAYTSKNKDYAFSSAPRDYDEIFEDDDG